MRAQQRQIVQEKSVDFIVMMLNVNTDVYDLIYPSLFFNYEVAAEQIDTVDNVSQVKFVLFGPKILSSPCKDNGLVNDKREFNTRRDLMTGIDLVKAAVRALDEQKGGGY